MQEPIDGLDRPRFVAELARNLIAHWPEGLSGDEALGLVAGLTDLAFPIPATPEPASVNVGADDIGPGEPAERDAASARPVDQEGEADRGGRRKRRAFDSGEDDVIRAGVAAGHNPYQIGKALGRVAGAVVNRIELLKRTGRLAPDVSGQALAAHGTQGSSLGGAI